MDKREFKRLSRISSLGFNNMHQLIFKELLKYDLIWK